MLLWANLMFYELLGNGFLPPTAETRLGLAASCRGASLTQGSHKAVSFSSQVRSL